MNEKDTVYKFPPLMRGSMASLKPTELHEN